jgi:hypothetical protein
MMRAVKTFTEADARHRKEFKSFVVHDAQPWHREHLGRLYKLWEDWNGAFFGGRMLAPYIIFSAPSSTRAFGDCSAISGFGGRLQIRIRETLMTGEHRHVHAGDQFAEGRFKFVADVLLHEMVHQHQIEVADKQEKAYKGHGPVFRDKCNEIGVKLSLPPVRVAKARGRFKDMPSCAHWPHCVRPAEYYEGALGAEYLARQSGGVRPKSENSYSDKLAEVVMMLASAANDFARICPIGAEEEAASIPVNGDLNSKSIQEKLTALCIAAREFSDVALLDWEEKSEK